VKTRQLGNSLKNLSRKVKVYLHITKARGIARRYFIMNGFDGAMTIFGIVLGSWMAGVTKPEVILLAGFGACLAMGEFRDFSELSWLKKLKESAT
jgi:hypothetical protein